MRTVLNNSNLGVPLSDLLPLQQLVVGPSSTHLAQKANRPGSTAQKAGVDVRPLSGITFVRNRMMYARAALNAKGDVRFGLRHIRK